MPYANNQGVRIYYEVEGNGPPLVLQHGLALSLEDWRDAGYPQALRNDYQLILIDARGHGHSDKPHEPKAYFGKLMVEDVVAVLDDLNVSKASYWGYSMGGLIGYSVARYAPERFSALILGGISPYISREDVAEQISQLLEAGMEAVIAILEEATGQPLPPENKARLLANDVPAITSSLQLFRTSYDVVDIVPTIGLPCLVYVGEADPFYDSTKECAGQMPNATFVSLPDLKHEEGFARSDLVLPHATKFLKEVGG